MVGSDEAVSAQGRMGCRSPRSSSASSTFCAPCSDPPSPTSTRRSGAAGSLAPTRPPKSPQRWMASSRGCWRARATERCRAGLLPTRLAVCVCLPCASHGLARHPARRKLSSPSLQPKCRCLQVSAAEVEATVAGSGMPEAWTQAMASRAEATAATFAAKDGKKCAPHLSDRLGITTARSHSRTRAFDESKERRCECAGRARGAWRGRRGSCTWRATSRSTPSTPSAREKSAPSCAAASARVARDRRTNRSQPRGCPRGKW